MSSTPTTGSKPPRHMGMVYLRILAAIMVVVLHAWYMKPGASEAHIWASSLIYSMAGTAVPLFVLISGAFLIPNTRNTALLRFWGHSFRKLFPLSLAFFVLAFFWQGQLWQQYTDSQFNTADFVWKILQWYGAGAEHPLWYLCMLPGLYVVVPFLAWLWQRIPAWHFAAIALLLMGLSIYANRSGITLPHPCSALFWLGYFMLGALLLQLARQKKLPPLWLLIPAAGIAIAGSLFYLFGELSQLPDFYKHLENLTYYPLMLLSFLLFCIFAQWNPAPRNTIIRLSGLTFLVYLVHMPCQRIICAILYHTGCIHLLHSGLLCNVLYTLAGVVSAFLAALVISWVYRAVFSGLK